MVELEKEQMLGMYRTMLKIRRFEEKVVDLFSEGLIPGFVHLYIGEEAVAVGVCANLSRDDYIASTHRGHGHCIAKGADLKRMMAELFGRETGYCKGLGGSMHIADLSLGILGATGIVGAGIPIAVGAALAARLKGKNSVSVAFFGDGANNQGIFHESLNLASIWKLPVIFVCENNQYGVSFHMSKSTSVNNIADRAVAYSIRGVVVDGNDVLAVYEAARDLVKRAREGQGPALLECKTYRIRGHFEGDPQSYRTREEVERWKEKDPVRRLRARLTEMNLMTDKEEERIEADLQRELAEAVEFAKRSPVLSAEKLTDYVFV